MKRAVVSYFVLSCLLFVPLVSGQEQVRVEKDLLGEKSIPVDAYYGVQTARALENFKLSGVLINHYPGFVEA
jgi:aspartate ammonia-lyase